MSTDRYREQAHECLRDALVRGTGFSAEEELLAAILRAADANLDELRECVARLEATLLTASSGLMTGAVPVSVASPPTAQPFPRAPLDDEEREACEQCNMAYGRCAAVGRFDAVDWVCSLVDGHAGDHIAACDDPDEVMFRWPSSPSSEPAKPAQRRCHKCSKPIPMGVAYMGAADGTSDHYLQCSDYGADGHRVVGASVGGKPAPLPTVPHEEPAPLTREEAPACVRCGGTGWTFDSFNAYPCDYCANPLASSPALRTSPPDEGRSEDGPVPQTAAADTIARAIEARGDRLHAAAVTLASTGRPSHAYEHSAAVCEVIARDIRDGSILRELDGKGQGVPPTVGTDLDDAIAHADEVAASYANTAPDCACAREHHQLAAWLRELVALRGVAPRVLASVEGEVGYIGAASLSVEWSDEGGDLQSSRLPAWPGAKVGDCVTLQVLPATGEEAK